MTDLFDARAAQPMLIAGSGDPFDSPDYVFELKLDGERFLAYLDADETTLINRRGVSYLHKFPELADLHRAASRRCIIDGEIVVLRDGMPDFAAVASRAKATGARIRLGAAQMPVSFVAFDILYLDRLPVTDLVQTERHRLLAETVGETQRLSLSRAIDEKGLAFFDLARARGLEGIIGKRKDGVYRMGKRSTDWIKIKNMLDDDFIICGYMVSPAGAVASLVLGQYDAAGTLVYKGRATLGLKTRDFAVIAQHPTGGAQAIPRGVPPEARDAVWLTPTLVGTVGYLQRTEGGGLRHPRFKALREDKAPLDVVEPAKLEATPRQ